MLLLFFFFLFFFPLVLIREFDDIRTSSGFGLDWFGILILPSPSPCVFVPQDPTGKRAVSPLALEEAGSMTVCRSGAWGAKMVTSAWWVYADQVRAGADATRAREKRGVGLGFVVEIGLGCSVCSLFVFACNLSLVACSL